MAEMKLVEVSLIKPDPNQPRKEFDEEEIKALSDGIKAQGLIHPIEIDEHNVIIDGERRWRAIKLLGWRTMTCIINPKVNEMNKKDEHYKLKRQLQANLTGRNLQIKEAREQIEQLVNVNEVAASGKKDAGIERLAKELGIGRSYLSLILKISREGSPSLIKAVESKQIEDTLVASQIASLPKETQDVVTDKIIDEEMNRADAQKLIKDMKDIPEDQAEEYVDELNDLNDMAKETAQALTDAYKEAKKLYPFDSEKAKIFTNKSRIKLILQDLKQGNLYCPKHNKNKLVWDCCHKNIADSIDGD